ncbi:BnaA01g28430D [Brassica napus]|nr:BnaA01g28430D [Brassica napus]
MWLVKSACHVWGRQAWNTGDLWVPALAFGEGWHNNHHAFDFLQAIGLATDVKLHSETHKQRMALNSE